MRGRPPRRRPERRGLAPLPLLERSLRALAALPRLLRRRRLRGRSQHRWVRPCRGRGRQSGHNTNGAAWVSTAGTRRWTTLSTARQIGIRV
jgi:hypothetical protein